MIVPGLMIDEQPKPVHGLITPPGRTIVPGLMIVPGLTIVPGLMMVEPGLRMVEHPAPKQGRAPTLQLSPVQSGLTI